MKKKKSQRAFKRFFEALKALAGGGSPANRPPNRPTSSVLGELVREQQKKNNS